MAKNVDIKVDKKKLIITVDLTQTQGASKSGKNSIIATTAGNMDIGHEGVKIGLNVYKPADAAK